MSTYLMRRGEVATVRFERWLGDEPRLLFRGLDDPELLAEVVVADVAAQIDPDVGLAAEAAARAVSVALIGHRYCELDTAEVARLLAPAATITTTATGEDRVAGLVYRLGIDDGQPGDVWFEIGWDAGLGSFSAMRWQRDVNGEVFDVPGWWAGHRSGELPDVAALETALGFRLPPGLTAELDADRVEFGVGRPAPGFDEAAFAKLFDDRAVFPRYALSAEGPRTVIERVDWDGADPVRVGAGEWSPISTLVRVDLDREDPVMPTPGTGARWWRLNDPPPTPEAPEAAQSGSWRVAFDPVRVGFVACHVVEDPDGAERVAASLGADVPITTINALAAAIGRDLPAPLASRLETEQVVFGPSLPPPDPSPFAAARVESPGWAPTLDL